MEELSILIIKFFCATEKKIAWGSGLEYGLGFDLFNCMKYRVLLNDIRIFRFCLPCSALCSVTHSDLLILFGKQIEVFVRNRIDHTNTLFVQNCDL